MPDYFVKNETSLPLDKDGTSGNHCDIGVRQATSIGTFEGAIAYKVNENSEGCFGEFKYTTPSVRNFALESRTRGQFVDTGNNMTERLALKYSQNLGKGFSIYNITGASANISFEGEGLKSITPVNLTGLGYSFNKKVGAYLEYEGTKSYNIKTKKWGNFSSNVYIGVKVYL